MDTTLLVEAASQAGVSRPGHGGCPGPRRDLFLAKETTPEHLSVWLAGLKTEAPHLFVPPTTLTTAEAVVAHYGVPYAVWQTMSPSDRMTLARRARPRWCARSPGTTSPRRSSSRPSTAKVPPSAARRRTSGNWKFFFFFFFFFFSQQQQKG